MSLKDITRTVSESVDRTDRAKEIRLREDGAVVVFEVQDRRGRWRRREIPATPEEYQAFRSGFNLLARANALVDSVYTRATAGL